MRRHALSKLYHSATLQHANLLRPSLSVNFARALAGGAIQDQNKDRSLLSIAAAALLAAAALTGAEILVNQDRKADCAAELPLPSANPKAEQFIDEFRNWLRRIGADTAAIDIRPCSEVSLPDIKLL